MQIVAKYFDEVTCLRVAYAFENARNWKELWDAG
jgi:Asp-tRNA(Asn)/Glu-tRNA(Gln) amidotransferase A subunit family amidase